MALAVTDDKILMGNRIRELREKAGLSQEALSEKVNMSPNAISRIELGQSDARSSSLTAIADVLGVPIEDLYPERLTRKAQPGDDMRELERLFSKLNPTYQSVAYETMKTMLVNFAGVQAAS